MFSLIIQILNDFKKKYDNEFIDLLTKFKK